MSLRLQLDGDFPIPRLTQISSVATRCSIAIFLPADALRPAVYVLPVPADKRHSPYESEARASVPVSCGSRRMSPFSRSAAVQILRSGS